MIKCYNCGHRVEFHAIGRPVTRCYKLNCDCRQLAVICPDCSDLQRYKT